MKHRSPLRHLLALPLVALLFAGPISPTAHADPTPQDSDSTASTAAAARGLTTMTLRKSNGVVVKITPQMQRNSSVVLDTIANAKWSGVSASDKHRLMVISLMTMAQESTFATHPSSFTPDRWDNVGAFQLRARVGWHADGNTMAENIKTLNDIPYSTRVFIEGHKVTKNVPGAAGRVGYHIPGVFQKKNWRTNPMWEVAADVQRPAAQYRYHYEYWRPVAEALVQALKGRPPASVGPDDVYTTAGAHTVNGRKWRTECGKYSSSVDRCTAKIWATQVTRVGDRFVPKNDYYFNNLTYLPSSRRDWVKNPLAHPGEFTLRDTTTKQDRKWKTSCADAWTGPDACRSFIWSNEVESYLDASGNRQYKSVAKWVFNNIVQFSD